MVVRELHIDGFGIFQDFSLALPGKGIQVIVGNNEAGKSTLLKFLRYTLFGYPRMLDQRMAPLRGGSHGGRISTQLSTGAEAIFERGGNDKIKLVFNGQESANASQWSQLLSNASPELYNNVYAFTLDELIGLGSLEDSGMEDKIFSLGLGLGNVSVAGLENTIREKTDQIYTSRGRNQLIPGIIKEMEQNNKKILAIRENLGTYQRITEDLQLLENQIGVADQELKQLRQESTGLEVYAKCYESFVVLKRAEQELSTLPPHQPWPPNGVQQMEKNIEKRSEISDKLKALQLGKSGERGIDELQSTLDNIDLDMSILEHQDKVDHIRRNLAGYIQAKKEREEEGAAVKALETEIAGMISDKISSRWKEQDVLDFQEEHAHRAKLEHFSTSLRTVTDEKRDWEAREKAILSTSAGFKTSAIGQLFAVIFVIASVPAFYYKMPLWGSFSVLIALIFYFARNVFSKKDPLIPVREKIKQLEDQQIHLLKDYHTWLTTDLKVSKDLSFVAMGNVFQTIAYTREKIQQRNALRQKIQEKRLPFIYDFETRIGNLVRYVFHDVTNTDVETKANAILETFDMVEEAYQKLVELTTEKERKEREKMQLENELKDTDKNIQDLLQSIDAPTEDAFFIKYAENQKVAELLETRKNAWEKIETVAGFNQGGEVVEYLSRTDKQSILQNLELLSVSIKEKETLLAEKQKEKGAKTKEKERIAGESDLAQILTLQESLRENLKDAFKEWLAGQMAIKVLSKVKAIYEKDKQPQVVKRSGEYFQTITDGAYAGMRASLEGREVSVYDHRGVSRNLAQLSRGTREQLLVSLRLGFIEEYEQQAEPLPVIIDEILVNFDPQRARQTAQILQDFAQTRQVLLFTCHPATLNFFDKEKINVFTIGNGEVI